MRVLITGGYGCIGSWITRNLLARGDEVWVFDLQEDSRRMRLLMSGEDVRRVGFLRGNVTDLAALQDAIRGRHISHVIHLAGLQVPVCRADPILGARVNVVGTLAVLEAVRRSDGQVERLVYASSAAVFGPPEHYPSGPLADDVPLSPTTHYGYFKCCNEGNARVYFQDHGLSSIGLRPWTVYGVGRDFGMTSEPTKAIKSLALGRPYHISYGGWQDLQFADDVAKVFVRCLEVPYRGARSYNLRGAVVDLAAFHRASRKSNRRRPGWSRTGTGRSPSPTTWTTPPSQRDLGPVPRTPLVDGVRRTLEHFRRLQAEGRLDTADLGA